MRPVECNGVTGMPEPDRPGCPETGFDPLAVIHGRRTRARPPGAGPPVARAAPWMALALTMLVAHPAPADTEAPRVSVFAAASLADALQEAADLFDRPDRPRACRCPSPGPRRSPGRSCWARPPIFSSPPTRPGPMRWRRRRPRRTRAAPRPVSATASSSLAMGPTARPPVSPEGLDLAAVLGDRVGSRSAWSRPSPPAATARPRSNRRGLWEVAKPSGADRQRARRAGAGRDRGGARRVSSTPPMRAPSRACHVIARFTETAILPSSTRLPTSPGGTAPAENALYDLPGERGRRDIRSARVRDPGRGADHDRMARPGGMAGRGPVLARRAVGDALSLPFGILTAYALSRWRFPGKALLNGLVHLPLVSCRLW
jgi:hypothetical protein